MIIIMDVYEALINIGIKLSSEQNLDRLLDLILQNARYICNADAGTLYLKEGNRLRFTISQNATLEMGIGIEAFKKLLSPFTLPISNKSIAGWSAKNKEVLNIEDVYKIENAPYRINKKHDKRTGYKCRSMLTVPMIDKEDNVVGVFQLINKRGGDKKDSFTGQDEKVAESLASQAAVAIRNTQLTEELKSAHLESIYMLGHAAEYKDKETGNHIKRVSEFSKAMAESLGMDDVFVETIYYASPLHDVGKIAVDQHVQNKPGKLTQEEYEHIMIHAHVGADIVRPLVNEKIVKIIEHHHDYYDGSGCNQVVTGTDIPLGARILTVADAFDALTSNRPYRPAMSKGKALYEIQRCTKTQFDPVVIDAFLIIMSKKYKVPSRVYQVRNLETTKVGID